MLEKLAGAEGLEPSVPVLETGGLPVNRRSQVKSVYANLFGSLAFFVDGLFTALLAKLVYFYFIIFLFAFCKIVVLIFTFRTRKYES